MHAGGSVFSFCDEVALGHGADGLGQGRRGIFCGPVVLIREDNAVHVTAADSDHRCAAGLALEGDETEGFLHAGVHKEVGSAVNPSELLAVALVRQPMDASIALAQARQVAPLGAIADHHQREARIIQFFKSIKKRGDIFLRCEATDVEQ